MIYVLMQKKFEKDKIEELEKKYNLKIYSLKKDELPPKEVLEVVEIYTGWSLDVPIELIPNLKWIHFYMAGIDRQVAMFKEMKNAPKVTNGSGTFDVPISEHTIAMLLALLRKINRYAVNQSERKWLFEGKMQEISSSTVGIVGFGSMGKHTAKLIKAFGAKVFAHKLSEIKKPDYVDEVFYGDEGLDEMLPLCDYVLLFLPGTDRTRHLFDKQRMLKMKKGAVITNVGRGFVIDHDALAELIEQGHIGGAALDVTEPEPLNTDHKLWELKNVLITPHVSYISLNDKWRMLEVFESNLIKYIENQKMPNEVDFHKGY